MRFCLLIAFFIFSTTVFAEEGFKNESEAGIVVNNGNSKSQSYNLKQTNHYGWDANEMKFQALYLNVSSLGITSAENWTFSLRYDRVLNPAWSLFVAETASGDRFAGINQKYASDIGAKYLILKDEGFSWSAEGGYRYSEEHRTDKTIHSQHLGRAYTEVVKTIGVASNGKFWIEYLPDLKEAKDYQINTEASISSILTDVFSIKMAYLLKFDNVPAKIGGVKTDTVFTTGLVAKF